MTHTDTNSQPLPVTRGSLWADRGWRLVYRCLEQPRLFEWFRVPIVASTQRIIDQELRLEPGRRVLDVCCGIGSFAIQRAGVMYVGLDYEFRYVRHAAEHRNGQPACRFLAADATQLPFQPGAFDEILWIYGLHHFSDGQARGILRSLVSLRPQHLLIIDLVGDDLRGMKRILAERDRGKYVRPVARQRAIIEESWLIEQSAVVPHRIILDTVYYRCVPRRAAGSQAG